MPTCDDLRMNAGAEHVDVLLAQWVLEDGNYDDFVVDTEREFALDFHVPWDMPLRHDDRMTVGFRSLGSYADYEVTADVVHADKYAVVLDFGLRAYCQTVFPVEGRGVRVGDRVSGRLSLGVDPFDYFEYLAPKRGLPPLIYSWHVTGLQIDVTPRIEMPVDDPRYPPHVPQGEGPFWIPDPARETWHEIERTRTWKDQSGVYRLRCRLLPEGPRTSFRSPKSPNDP